MQTRTIVITGPESTGKTTLTAELAAHFGVAWMPEFAREYIDLLNREYTETDLLEIAKGQLKREQEFTLKSNGLLFFDTSLEVIKIWSEYKYGRCHPWILEQLKNQKHDLYLLCSPDIPWEYDPQQESPNERDELFKLYHQELTEQNTKFVEINGLNDLRLTKALHHVQPLLHQQTYANHA